MTLNAVGARLQAEGIPAPRGGTHLEQADAQKVHFE
jgi:hypothetical protein